MQVYTLCMERWASTAFGGEGAIRYAGRWHFAGTPMVYTASTRALAALETLVHLEIRHASPNFVMIPADVPDELVQPLEDLPPDWDALPGGDVTRRIGSAWIQSRASLALQAPSAVVRGEHNVLLNPLHADCRHWVLGEPEPFAFDPRLLSARDLV